MDWDINNTFLRNKPYYIQKPIAKPKVFANYGRNIIDGSQASYWKFEESILGQGKKYNLAGFNQFNKILPNDILN